MGDHNVGIINPGNRLKLRLGAERFNDYLMASVGMLPGTLLYVYYGKLAGDVATLVGGAAAVIPLEKSHVAGILEPYGYIAASWT